MPDHDAIVLLLKAGWPGIVALATPAVYWLGRILAAESKAGRARKMKAIEALGESNAALQAEVRRQGDARVSEAQANATAAADLAGRFAKIFHAGKD